MKTNLILIIYDTLISGGKVERKSFCLEHNVSERTFYRYLHEIFEFFIRYNPEFIIDVKESTAPIIKNKAYKIKTH